MAHPDFDGLWNVLLPFARQMLEEYGEFHPFGASMGDDGTITMVGAKVEGQDFPKAIDLIEALEATFYDEAERGTIRASGICMDVRVVVAGATEKSDAVQASLEHSEAEPINVFLPYTKDSLGAIQYGTIFASTAEPKIFIPGIMR
jgi:hypothetical protein